MQCHFKVWQVQKIYDCFFFFFYKLEYNKVIFVVNTWIWGFTTGSQSVPKSCTTMKWAYLHNNTKLPTLPYKVNCKIQQTIVEVWIYDRFNSGWVIVLSILLQCGIEFWYNLISSWETLKPCIGYFKNVAVVHYFEGACGLVAQCRTSDH